MRLVNLGPIKDSQVHLNDMNIFIGKNGTGKTIVAYALFSFLDWLKQSYKVSYLTPERLSKLSKENGLLVLDTKTVVEDIAADVVKQFNSLNPSYFTNFFKDPQIFREDDTKITVDYGDVYSFLNTINAQGWFQVWPITSSQKSKQDNLTSQNLRNSLLVQRSEHDDLDQILLNYELVDSDNKRANLPPISKDNIDLNEQINAFLANDAYIATANLSLHNVLFPNRYTYLPAERIGYDVFRRSIKGYRLNYISANSSTSTGSANSSQQVNNESTPITYPTPIERYIQADNNALDNNGAISSSEEIRNLQKQLVKGKFHYEHETDKVSYTLPSLSTGKQSENITFDMISSSLKSLFGLNVILNTIQQNDWIFIDEPEMNLHPAKQKEIAQILYQLAKMNVNLVISTHSDYFIKSLVNELLKDELKVKSGEKESQNVSVFQFIDHSVQNIPDLTSEDSDLSNFDSITDQINNEYFMLLQKLDEIQSMTNGEHDES